MPYIFVAIVNCILFNVDFLIVIGVYKSNELYMLNFFWFSDPLSSC